MTETKVVVLNQMNIPISIQLKYDQTSEQNINRLNRTINEIDAFFTHIDETYSPFKANSVVSRHPAVGEQLPPEVLGQEYESVFAQTIMAREATDGIFNPFHEGHYNPTGFVKGWAVETAFFNFVQPLINQDFIIAGAINAGGDMQLGVSPFSDFTWSVGIENPLDPQKIIATYALQNGAIATSGLNKRGAHIWDAKAAVNQQNTVTAAYLSIADVWATVGIATTQEKWTTLIKEKSLTGISVNNTGLILPFEQGVLRHDQRSQILS